MSSTHPPTVSSTGMSYEEFLEVYDGQHAEWVDGEVVPLTPVSDRHQNIADFLAALLRFYAEARDLGVVRSAPFQMITEHSAREPDVMFVAGENADRIRPDHVEGPADLAVEVISPTSRARDRSDKFYEYEQAGVREYWLIDPDRQRAEFYRLTERGVYEPFLAEDGRVESRVLPGLWLEVDWLWREPLPPLLSVLKAWGLV